MNNLSRIEMLEKTIKKLIEHSRECADDFGHESGENTTYEYYVKETLAWLEATKAHIELSEDEAYWRGVDYGKVLF